MAFTGPTYETPAEVEMAYRVGADAVGMSTVPETIVANSLKIKVGGISCICNMASGIHPVPLTHKEVVEAADLVKADFKHLLDTLIDEL
jgi:purine-nucleoside phosphorylase